MGGGGGDFRYLCGEEWTLNPVLFFLACVKLHTMVPDNKGCLSLSGFFHALVLWSKSVSSARQCSGQGSTKLTHTNFDYESTQRAVFNIAEVIRFYSFYSLFDHIHMLICALEILNIVTIIIIIVFF